MVWVLRISLLLLCGFSCSLRAVCVCVSLSESTYAETQRYVPERGSLVEGVCRWRDVGKGTRVGARKWLTVCCVVHLCALFVRSGKGGKNRRRGKNQNDEKKELVLKTDGQEYAQVCCGCEKGGTKVARKRSLKLTVGTRSGDKNVG